MWKEIPDSQTLSKDTQEVKQREPEYLPEDLCSHCLQLNLTDLFDNVSNSKTEAPGSWKALSVANLQNAIANFAHFSSRHAS